MEVQQDKKKNKGEEALTITNIRTSRRAKVIKNRVVLAKDRLTDQWDKERLGTDPSNMGFDICWSGSPDQ